VQLLLRGLNWKAAIIETLDQCVLDPLDLWTRESEGPA